MEIPSIFASPRSRKSPPDPPTCARTRGGARPGAKGMKDIMGSAGKVGSWSRGYPAPEQHMIIYNLVN